MRKRLLAVIVSCLALALCMTLFVACDDNENKEPEKVYFTVEYYNTHMHGELSGELVQRIEKGANGTPVTATAKDGYVFVGWSDGVTTATRWEENVQKNLRVYPMFEKTFKVEYSAGVGGKIDGAASQTVQSGSDAQTVVAAPNDGYWFVAWSDGVETAERTDLNIIANLSVTAQFKPKTKTFACAYGVASGTLSGTLTINKDAENNDTVPPVFNDYIFCGWYADKDFDLCVFNEDGEYMLGSYGFTCDIDILFAKWVRIDDEIDATYAYTPLNDTDCQVRILNKSIATIAVIPSTTVIDGKMYSVTTIASNGFASSPRLKTVVLSSMIKIIKSSAFVNCGALEYVDLASVEEIGHNAFRKCNKLLEIFIPHSVMVMGTSVFYECKTSVKVQANSAREQWLSSWNDGNENQDVIYGFPNQ